VRNRVFDASKLVKKSLEAITKPVCLVVMKRKRRKRIRRWDSRYDPAWYSTAELDGFIEWLDARISRRSQPVHADVAQRARLQTERDRREHEILQP
jgi:hypothetical protein